MRTTIAIAKLEVDFIGIHAIFDTPTKKQEKTYQRMISLLHKNFPKTRSVLVTRQENIDKLVEIYNAVPADLVQLHCSMTKDQKLKLLDKLLLRGYHVDIMNVVSFNEFSVTQLSHVLGEFLLIDRNYLGGTGEEVENNFIADIRTHLPGHKILLAGGISQRNVVSKITNLAIDGVDVQSSLEIDNDPTGKKDIGKVKRFVQRIRDVEKKL